MMYSEIEYDPHEVSRQWPTFVLRGIAAIVFGFGSLIWPDISLAVLIALFGAFALVDGVVALYAGVKADRNDERWPLLFIGVAGVIAGVGAFLWPGLTALALLYVIAAWALFI